MRGDRWFVKALGSSARTPIAGFDEDGRPLVPDIGRDGKAFTGTFTGEAVDIGREGPVIAAGPGWYVLYGQLEGDGSLSLLRRPVIAWEARHWGDAFVVNDCNLEDEEPVVSVSRTTTELNCFAYRTFHGVYQPEPETIEADVRAYVEAVKYERARREREAGR